MSYIRKSEQRGTVNLDWLNSKHSFSFGHYHDPKHMGVSVLRVINDDTVAPGKGFDTHGHRDMEIISYVTEGALKHEDSQGNKHVVPAGDVQRMSAGTGVTHSEYNASTTEPVNFLQIWITPKQTGLKPSYAQKSIKQTATLTPIVTPTGAPNALSINQDVNIGRLILQQEETFRLAPQQSLVYLHILKGELMVHDELFGPGDAFSLEPTSLALVKATQAVEALWFTLPSIH